MAASSLWRRLFRFSLGGLLFVTLCTCVYLGSHRVGERAGARQQYDESFFVKTYNVEDLVIEAETMTERYEILGKIVAGVQEKVSPQSWGKDGCEIADMPSFGGLVVSQFGKAHDQIPLALKELRRQRLDSSTRRALERVHKLDRGAATEPAVLISYPQSNFAEAGRAIALRFDELTEELTKTWGSPTFEGECTDEGFPAWSAAQKLAAWPRDGGDLYLAVQFNPGVGEAVVAGWHAGE